MGLYSATYTHLDFWKTIMSLIMKEYRTIAAQPSLCLSLSKFGGRGKRLNLMQLMW
jgi:hypothetical protein